MLSRDKSFYMVSGSWPPEVCGVGDYMGRLSEALRHRGVEVQAIHLTRYAVSRALKALIGSYAARRVVYMSYPTEGYGKSLLPFVLAFGHARRVVLHMHEYGSKNRYCRFLLRRFRSLKTIYFSNAHDREQYIRDCGLAGQDAITRDWRVVPTPSNIPVCEAPVSRSDSRLKIVHFGQIRPGKGLEVLADAYALLADASNVDLVLIGGVPRGYEAYADDIMARFRNASARVMANLAPEEISHELASSHIGLFCFPDGADERRGSLVAAMAHGLLCVTTHSARTPDAIRSATIGVEVDPASGQEADAAALAQAVRTAAGDFQSARHAAMVREAREVGRRASFEGIAGRLVDDARL